MRSGHSAEDLLGFLSHAAERGLMPATTAQALAVATRNVLVVLTDDERADLPVDDLDGIIQRFNNKRARDFNPASLKEYGRRVKRAVELYLRWREDPSNFSVKTRATASARRKERVTGRDAITSALPSVPAILAEESSNGAVSDGYQSAFPVRSGRVVTVSNIPLDLTVAEAERLAGFIRLLAPA